MDKEFADRMIEKFQKKFFGYALSKTADFDEAEELASRIVCEAYATLRSVEGVTNWEVVKLSEEVVDPDDIEMLEDLIVAATNEALRKMEEENSAMMEQLTGGLGGLGGLF